MRKLNVMEKEAVYSLSIVYGELDQNRMPIESSESFKTVMVDLSRAKCSPSWTSWMKEEPQGSWRSPFRSRTKIYETRFNEELGRDEEGSYCKGGSFIGGTRYTRGSTWEVEIRVQGLRDWGLNM